MPANVLRTELEYSGENPAHTTENVLHWMKSDTSEWTLPDVADFVDEFESQTTGDDSFKDCISEDLSLAKLTCHILADPPVGPFVKTLGIEGTLGEGAAPPQVAVLVNIYSFGHGRNGNGRIFLPGFPESAIDAAGKIGGSNVSGLRTNLSTFVGNMGDEGYVLAVFSRVNDEAYEVDNLTVQDMVATQRRRTGRRIAGKRTT